MEHQTSKNRVAPWVEKHFPYQLSLLLFFATASLPACETGRPTLGGGATSFPVSNALLLESGITCDNLEIKGLGEARRPSSKSRTQERDRFYGSIKAAHPGIGFAAGWRYLPGPRTSFLVDESMVQVLSPSARQTPSVFVQALPEFYLPGIFAIQGSKRPGFYFRDPSDRTFVAMHPESGLGAVAVALSKGFPFTLFADIVRIRFAGKDSPWTTEGTASFLLSEPFTLSIEAARERRWDLDSKQQLDTRRMGRSGLVSLFGSAGYLFGESAGQDLDRNRMRVAGGGLRFQGEDLPLGLILRGRAYEARTYGTATRQPDSAAGIGTSISRRNITFEMIYEARRLGAPGGEVSLQWKTQYFESALTAFARATSSKYPSTFTFMRTTPQYSNGARFFAEEHSGLQLRIKAKFLYLYLSTARGKKTSRQFAILEAKLEL
ncbi:MAG: hypothetical protein K8S54_10925 [Spirochaetia bacterium]|nr:hypothetical protein [Spirochaetia bacterium]